MRLSAGTRRAIVALGLALAAVGGVAMFMTQDSIDPTAFAAPGYRMSSATDASCPTALTGRSLIVTQPSFGTVQGRPRLPLDAGEYVLTIDDGPSPHTAALLEILAKYCVKATFMDIGRNADRLPESVKAQLTAGHGVGSHSYSHGGFGAMDEAARNADILRGADAVVRAATGRPRSLSSAAFYRTPGDAGVPLLTPDAWLAYLASQHLTLAGYDISPQDWKNDPPAVTYQRLFFGLPDRGVIVLHDGPANTPMLLDMALDGLQRRGAHIVSIKLPTFSRQDAAK